MGKERVVVMITKYSRIPHIDSDEVVRVIKSLETNKYVIEEKVDGSQFRIYVSENGEPTFGSHGVDFQELEGNYVFGEKYQKVESMFSLAIKRGLEVAERWKTDHKGESLMLFCEFMHSERENTLLYERVPKNNLYLFDAKINGELVKEEEKLINLANYLELEPVNVYAILDHFPTIEEAHSYYTKPSCLGGIIEGVVIKNREAMVERYGNITFFAMKAVNTSFTQLNKETWRKERKAGIRSIDDLIDFLFEKVDKQTIWAHTYAHTKEEGNLTGQMRDMVELIKTFEKDFEEDYRETVSKLLYESLKSKIIKQGLRGLAEWYKDKLIENLGNSLNS
jgi:hypothetical protein